MIDPNTVRRIALAFPETEERSHHGQPDFRVRNKIFATLRPDRGCSVLKLPPELHASLLADHPEGFRLNGWSKHGWIEVVLDEIDEDRFAALAEEAWRTVAPKKLAAAWDGLPS